MIQTFEENDRAWNVFRGIGSIKEVINDHGEFFYKMDYDNYDSDEIIEGRIPQHILRTEAEFKRGMKTIEIFNLLERVAEIRKNEKEDFAKGKKMDEHFQLYKYMEIADEIIAYIDDIGGI